MPQPPSSPCEIQCPALRASRLFLRAKVCALVLLTRGCCLALGLAGAAACAAAELRPGLKALCISGYASEDSSRELHLEVGVNFLRKPFVLQTLVQLVRHRLDEPKA